MKLNGSRGLGKVVRAPRDLVGLIVIINEQDITGSSSKQGLCVPLACQAQEPGLFSCLLDEYDFILSLVERGSKPHGHYVNNQGLESPIISNTCLLWIRSKGPTSND